VESNNLITSVFNGSPLVYTTAGVLTPRQFNGWFIVGFPLTGINSTLVVTTNNGVTLKQGDFGKLNNADGSVTIFNSKDVTLIRNGVLPGSNILLLTMSTRYPFRNDEIIAFRLPSSGIFVATGEALIIPKGSLRINFGRQ
jgi:hypothetical protein